MNILIDGYHLSVGKGTGIATYTRNLAKAIKQAHNKLSIIYDFPAHSGYRRNQLLDEVLLFDAIDKSNMSFNSQPMSRKLANILLFLQSLVMAPRPKVFESFKYVEREVFKSRFPECDIFMNLPDIFNLSLIYFYIFRRLLKISVEGADIVHWTYPIPLQVVNAKNLYTIHDVIPLKLPFATLDNKKFFYHLAREICHTADRIVTVSEYSKRDLCDTYNLPNEKVVNTYQSVSFTDSITADMEVIKSDLYQLYGLKYKEYFVAVGSVEPRKNFKHLIEAYRISNVRKPLAIVGPLAPNHKQELALYNKFSDDKNLSSIRLLGYVPSHHLTQLVQGAIAMVFPSLYEGFGLPVLEAMKLGTPVITSNTSSLPEIGGEAPVYVNPYSVESIKEAMIRVEQDAALREEMISKGLIQCKKFSFDNYVKRVFDLYRSL